jgi:hypothetical protein
VDSFVIAYRAWNRRFVPGEGVDPNQIPDFPLAIGARHAIRVFQRQFGEGDPETPLTPEEWDLIPNNYRGRLDYEPPYPIELHRLVPIPEDLRDPLLRWIDSGPNLPYGEGIEGESLYLLDDPWSTPFPANWTLHIEGLIGLILLRRGFRPERSTLSPQTRSWFWFLGPKPVGPVKPLQVAPPLPRGKDRRAGFEEPAEVPTGPE